MHRQVKPEDCSGLANHRKDESYESEDVSLSKSTCKFTAVKGQKETSKTYQRTEWRRERSARARERRLEAA